MIIDFEYIKKKHINENVAKIMKNIFKKHKIETRIFVIIINNVFNNIIFFNYLMKSISSILNYVNVSSKNDETKKTNENEKTFNVMRVFCLIHVFQLTLQIFLNFVKVFHKNLA
jgi:hypoxanthine-guanine phosphoribosyltransferase